MIWIHTRLKNIRSLLLLRHRNKTRVMRRKARISVDIYVLLCLKNLHSAETFMCLEPMIYQWQREIFSLLYVIYISTVIWFCAYAHTHTRRARACTHTRTHARTHALTHTRTNTYTHTHARTHACMHARTHARTHAHTHTTPNSPQRFCLQLNNFSFRLQVRTFLLLTFLSVTDWVIFLHFLFTYC